MKQVFYSNHTNKTGILKRAPEWLQLITRKCVDQQFRNPVN